MSKTLLKDNKITKTGAAVSSLANILAYVQEGYACLPLTHLFNQEDLKLKLPGAVVKSRSYLFINADELEEYMKATHDLLKSAQGFKPPQRTANILDGFLHHAANQGRFIEKTDMEIKAILLESGYHEQADLLYSSGPTQDFTSPAYLSSQEFQQALSCFKVDYEADAIKENASNSLVVKVVRRSFLQPLVDQFHHDFLQELQGSSLVVLALHPPRKFVELFDKLTKNFCIVHFLSLLQHKMLQENDKDNNIVCTSKIGGDSHLDLAFDCKYALVEIQKKASHNSAAVFDDVIGLLCLGDQRFENKKLITALLQPSTSDLASRPKMKL